MKREISTTSVIVVTAMIVVALIGAAVWIWGPASAGSAGPARGTPESAAAARERGRTMRESFMASHRRNGQRGAGPTQGDDTQQ